MPPDWGLSAGGLTLTSIRTQKEWSNTMGPELVASAGGKADGGKRTTLVTQTSGTAGGTATGGTAGGTATETSLVESAGAVGEETPSIVDLRLEL